MQIDCCLHFRHWFIKQFSEFKNIFEQYYLKLHIKEITTEILKDALVHYNDKITISQSTEANEECNYVFIN